MKNSILMIAILLLSLSCKDVEKTVDSSKNLKGDIETADNYNQFRDMYADASILLVRSSDFNSSTSLVERFSVGFINEEMIVPSAIYLNGNILNKSNDYTIHQFYDEGLSDDVYGTELSIAFETKVVPDDAEGTEISVGFNTDVLSDDFYNPAPLNVDCNITENFTIGSGMTFNWNKYLGSKGVVFKIRADKGANPDIISSIEKEIILEDNGSFTIPAEWLVDFPDGAIVSASLSRGSYKMMNTSKNLSVGIIAFSSCEGMFIKM